MHYVFGKVNCDGFKDNSSYLGLVLPCGDRKVGTFLFSLLAGIRTLNLWIIGQVFYYCATGAQVGTIFAQSVFMLSAVVTVLSVIVLSVNVLSDVLSVIVLSDLLSVIVLSYIVLSYIVLSYTVLSDVMLSDIVLSVVVLNYQYCI